MKDLLKGKRAVVTGGSRGIGFGIAQSFVESGARVAITGRDEASLGEASKKLGAGSALPLIWDVARAEIAGQKIEEAAQALGGLDIVVNNAGVLTPHDLSHSFFEITPEEYDYVQEINLRGVFFVCQAAASYMMSHNIRGHMINICSEMGFSPVHATYGITKWGVRGLTLGLGRLLAPKGITVNGIAPGITATQMVGWKEGDSVEYLAHPNGRYGLPSDMGELAVFLASGLGENIVGQCILSDGGHSLRRV
ncbi:MAG: SDR family oxidoreductase [Clostridiales bacterium]|jgi:3-oxoacyl-[acyl-carrier protein] reductase|nr:SDR family oxidoreductase [Clostridiales bacterium]